jgi:hypothetical protein
MMKNSETPLKLKWNLGRVQRKIEFNLGKSLEFYSRKLEFHVIMEERGEKER